MKDFKRGTLSKGSINNLYYICKLHRKFGKVKLLKKILALTAAALCVLSCDFISSIIHDDALIARIGRDKLYASQLAGFIPKNISPEDSVNLAMQYISTWALERLYLDVAEERLSKSELDVSKELEDYRRSLLKFRYEQHYINDRLDTLVSGEEMKEYYNTHKDLFVLNVPIVKSKYLDILQESANYEQLKKNMASQTEEDAAMADTLAYASALKYEDRSDEWVSAVELSRNFGTDYGTLLSHLGHDGFIEIPQDKGDVKIAYICDIRKVGTLAPYEYCEQRIRDIIINVRKHSLVSDLERDLLDEGLEHKKLVIY